MPEFSLSSLKRGKIILLLLMIMLLGFLFLMNQERERKIIYKGAAGEEKEEFLARGAYESLEAKRNEKLPKEQSKTAEVKQEGRENRKIEDSLVVGSQENREKQENLEGSKKAKKEENPEISKEESQEESKEDSGNWFSCSDEYGSTSGLWSKVRSGHNYDSNNCIRY